MTSRLRAYGEICMCVCESLYLRHVPGSKGILCRYGECQLCDVKRSRRDRFFVVLAQMSSFPVLGLLTQGQPRRLCSGVYVEGQF